ncbi:MAG TPA: hypothetical protein EYP14_19430 [Planctomycetaceae bacterium]|nr:hypothetical protein [Planctomycetaceae bacterium]
MTAETCAPLILEAAARRKRDLIMSVRGRLGLALRLFSRCWWTGFCGARSSATDEVHERRNGSARVQATPTDPALRTWSVRTIAVAAPQGIL